MRGLTLSVPDPLQLDGTEIVLFLAAKLYESGKLSLGQAAERVGLSKPTFAEIISKYRVAFFNYPASEVSRNVKNA